MGQCSQRVRVEMEEEGDCVFEMEEEGDCVFEMDIGPAIPVQWKRTQ